MAKHDKENWFSDSSCLSLDVLTDYINNKLDGQASMAVEKHLADCELCTEALAGLEMDTNLETLPFLLDDMKQEFEQKHFAGTDAKGGRGAMYYLYRVTAAAAIVVIAVGGYYFLQWSKTTSEAVSLDKIYADYYRPYPNVITTAGYSERIHTDDSNREVAGEKDKNVNAKAAKEKEQPTKVMDDKVVATKTVNGAKDEDVANTASGGAMEPVKTIAGDSVTVTAGTATTLSKQNTSNYTWVTPAQGQATNTSIPPEPIQAVVKQDNSVVNQNDRYELKNTEKKSDLNVANTSQPPSASVNMDLQQQITASPQNEVLLDRAMQMYDNNDHDSAIVLFNEILQDEPTNATVQFYEANSYLQEGDLQRGMNNFKTLSRDRNNQYYQASQWYLALSYLKDGDKQSAIPILTDLAYGDGPYKDKANEILKLINK